MDFQTLLDLQLQLQKQSFGVDPTKLRGDELADFIRWNAYALEDELHEATAEVGWKPWATSRHVNSDRVGKELVDLLHFFANLCLATGVTGDMLSEGYMGKRKENARRQQEGYTGVKEKCPNCHRDLAETGCNPVIEYCEDEPEKSTKAWRS